MTTKLHLFLKSLVLWTAIILMMHQHTLVAFGICAVLVLTAFVFITPRRK